MGFDIIVSLNSGFNPLTGEVFSSAPIIPEEFRRFLYTTGDCWWQVVEHFEKAHYTADEFYKCLPKYEDLKEKDELEEEEYEEFKTAMKWFVDARKIGSGFIVGWSR